MGALILIAIVVLTSGVHRYAVDYGYRGLSSAAARENAQRVAVVLAVILISCYGISAGLR